MEFEIKNINELEIAAKMIIEKLNTHKIICFFGEIGAGKTTLIKKVCEILEVKEIVNSPTFSIVNEYTSKFGTIFHFDFYRIENIEEAENIGIKEYFYSQNICLIEWPEIICSILPDEYLKVEINEINENRIIKIEEYDK